MILQKTMKKRFKGFGEIYEGSAMRKVLLTGGFLVLLLVFHGCDHLGLNAPDNPVSPPPWVTEPHIPPQEYLAFTWNAPEEVNAGEVVDLELKVANTSNKTLKMRVLTDPGTPSKGNRGFYDFGVIDEDSLLHWRNYHNIGAPDMSVFVTLQPSDTLSLIHEWQGRNLSGESISTSEYQLTGVYRIGKVLIDPIPESDTAEDTLVNERGYYTPEPQPLRVK